MERDVYISIRGLHQYMDQDGYDHDVEVVSAGKYYKKNGQHIVSYKEQFAHEDKPVRAMVKVDQDGLLVSRSGEMASQMHFQPMRRNLTVYRTPFGVMEMGVTTNTLKMVWTSTTGRSRSITRLTSTISIPARTRSRSTCGIPRAGQDSGWRTEPANSYKPEGTKWIH